MRINGPNFYLESHGLSWDVVGWHLEGLSHPHSWMTLVIGRNCLNLFAGKIIENSNELCESVGRASD